MLPTSSNKICCNEQTCPKRNQRKENRTPTSSSIVDMAHQSTRSDKETQTSLVATSPSAHTLISTKTAEEPAEAYSDGNYANISSPLAKYCSLNSFETSPRESQMLSTMLNRQTSTTTAQKFQSWHQPQPLAEDYPKCTCKKIDITPSSSRSGFSSEYLQINVFFSKRSKTQYRAQHLQRTPIQNYNISHDERPIPQILQTERPNSPKGSFEVLQVSGNFSSSFDQQRKTDDRVLSNDLNDSVTSYEEQFYSCDSGDSESDEKSENVVGSRTRCYSNKNNEILQLLHDVENLVNKDYSIQQLETEVVPSSPAISSSKNTTQESKTNLKLNDKISKPTSTTELDYLLWLPQPCFCNCRAYAPPNNFSFFPPFNVTAPALDATQIPEPFVFEENYNLRNDSTGNKNILAPDQPADNLSGICSAAHAPVEYDIKAPCSLFEAASYTKEDVSIQANDSLRWKVEMGTQVEAPNNQSLCQEIGSFKDCSSGKSNICAADEIPAHLNCKCICNQILLENEREALALPCVRYDGSKSNDHLNLTVAEPCLEGNSLDSLVNGDFCQDSLEIEEYIDEELHPRYVDTIFTEPFNIYKINTDALPEYDDEEPVLGKFSDGVLVIANFQNGFQAVEKIAEEVSKECTNFENLSKPDDAADMDNLPDPIELVPTAEEGMSPYPIELGTVLETEKELEAVAYKEFKPALSKEPTHFVTLSKLDATDMENLPDPIELVPSSEQRMFPHPIESGAGLETEEDSESVAYKEFKEVVKPALNKELSKLDVVDMENLPEPIELVPTAELEVLSGPRTLIAVHETEMDKESLAYKEFEEVLTPGELTGTEKLQEPAELIEVEKEKLLKDISNAELDELSYNKDDGVKEVEKPIDKSEESDDLPSLRRERTPSFIGYTSPAADNFLPELDKLHDSETVIIYKYSGEEDDELAKEKLAENRDSSGPHENYRIFDNEIALVSKEQAKPKRCSSEMKFFIDSLMLDLEAMNYARCKSQFEKNICNSKKSSPCIRNSFPVTITEVTDLGANSLYVKWKIHDCFGIGGYEIYTDGYLTNRFHNSRHQAAVITHVDITLPHRIALVAQPQASDESIDFICNVSRKSNKLKSLPWTSAGKSQQQSSQALWTPSIFLYDPISERSLEKNEI